MLQRRPLRHGTCRSEAQIVCHLLLEERSVPLAALLAVLTTSTFGSLADLNLDTHDHENLLISEDYIYLLSTAKHHTSGRPLYELIIWLEIRLLG